MLETEPSEFRLNSEQDFWRALRVRVNMMSTFFGSYQRWKLPGKVCSLRNAKELNFRQFSDEVLRI